MSNNSPLNEIQWLVCETIMNHTPPREILQLKQEHLEKENAFYESLTKEQQKTFRELSDNESDIIAMEHVREMEAAIAFSIQLMAEAMVKK